MIQRSIRERTQKKTALAKSIRSKVKQEQPVVERSLTLQHLSPSPFTSLFLPLLSSLLYLHAHPKCTYSMSPPTYNHSLLLTFHKLYTQCDTLCLSPLYNIHIYIAFTIIYWHCSYKTVISCLATYSSAPNPASHHCLQPSFLWASTSCRFLLRLFVCLLVSYLYFRNIWHHETFKRRGCVGWVGQEKCHNDQ